MAGGEPSPNADAAADDPPPRTASTVHEGVATSYGAHLATWQPRASAQTDCHVAAASNAQHTTYHVPHLRRDRACPIHICAGTGLALIHICTGTALTRATSASGLGLQKEGRQARACSSPRNRVSMSSVTSELSKKSGLSTRAASFLWQAADNTRHAVCNMQHAACNV